MSEPLFPGTPFDPPLHNAAEIQDALQALTQEIPAITGQNPAIAPTTGGMKAVPTGSIPTASVPAASVPTTSVQTGSVPTGSVATGSVSTGSVATGSIPTGSVAVATPPSAPPPVVPQQQPRPTAPPTSAPGWGSAAIAINSFRHIENPLVLFLQPQGHQTIIIDLMAHEYSWATPLAQFPREPGVVAVGTQPITLNSPSPMVKPGLDLDALLWLIGLEAFPRGRAPWLGADEKFRLRRWPYFEALQHTADQEKLIKVLARGFMTVDKLAAAAKVDRSEAQRVVNALALMMALRRTGGDTAMPGIAGGGSGDLSTLPPPGRF